MKKIGNRPITKADTDFSKMSTKNQVNRTEFWMNFGLLCAHFGTVTQCLTEPIVPNCAHKIPTFIQNSTKVHQTPLITNENLYQNAMHKVLMKSAWPKV